MLKIHAHIPPIHTLSVAARNKASVTFNISKPFASNHSSSISRWSLSLRLRTELYFSFSPGINLSHCKIPFLSLSWGYNKIQKEFSLSSLVLKSMIQCGSISDNNVMRLISSRFEERTLTTLAFHFVHHSRAICQFGESNLGSSLL